MNTQGRTKIWSAEETTQNPYDRIRNSQGNLSDENVSSDRYRATSDMGWDRPEITISSGIGSSDDAGGDGSPGPGGLERVERTAPGDSDVQDSADGAKTDSSQNTYIEDSQLAGPTVEEVSVSERFHEDYGIYEEAISRSQFFYATVGNGEITDGQVSIELPANMEYVMEKDGVAMDYASGQVLTEKGSYILKISAVEDASVPFSRQKIYKAVFRFRIQEKAASAESRQSPGSYGSYGSSGASGSGYGSGSLFDALEEETSQAPEEETRTETTAEEESQSVSGEESEADREEGSTEESSLDESSLEAIVENAIGQGYGTEHLEGYNENTGLVSGYDRESGYYRHQLASGEVFFTDVPNGMTTNYSVRILTNDNLPFRVFKDGEAIEYVPGTAIEEAGSYGVYPYSESTIYLSSYAGKEEPLFWFRILGEAVNDLGIINAPEHGRIADVRYTPASKKTEGENQAQAGVSGSLWEPPAFAFCDDWCYVKEDGRYQIDIETETGISTLEFRKDTRSPYFRYEIQGNTALIRYAGTDVAACSILQDGNLIHSGSPVREIEGPGDFEFIVYDKAGNRGSSNISIPYKMNTAAILVVVLFVLLFLVLGVMVRRIKRQVKVV